MIPSVPVVAGRRRPALVLACVLATVVALLVVQTPASRAAVVPDTARASHAAAAPRYTSQGLADLAELPPVMSCTDTLQLRLSRYTDAAVMLHSATVVTTGAAQPYCEVTGTIAPDDTIVVRLPMTGWSQRYVQTGCGGECGSSDINVTMAGSCPYVADGSLALATTDMGHQGSPDGSWAANSPQAQIDFAYRGVHVTSQVAKALITKFYGHAPQYSYFDGCSDGGREALMEAQRYPHDFDGIAAGAPANDMDVQNTYHHAWNVLTNLDADGHYILLADKLPMIHAAVLAACDGIDGVRDGVIDDPRACHFDPATLTCTAGQDDSTCLTPAQVGVVRRLHDGATTASGARLEPAISHEWGSELDWTLFIPTAQGQTVGSENFVLAFARYLGFTNTVLPNWELKDLKLTEAGFWKTVASSGYLAAMDPNLSQFRRAGGKLLLWHGWADQHISPQSTLAYYNAVQKTMGAGTVTSFLKLYLFPGVAHCGGGEGPNQFDVLTPVMAWTESGRSPHAIIASKVDSSGTTVRTRPVYPYPAVARYDGSGSTDVAANFVPYTPATEPGPDYHWIGQRLYSSDYQQSCVARDTRLVCRPRSTWLTRRAARA